MFIYTRLVIILKIMPKKLLFPISFGVRYFIIRSPHHLKSRIFYKRKEVRYFESVLLWQTKLDLLSRLLKPKETCMDFIPMAWNFNYIGYILFIWKLIKFISVQFYLIIFYTTIQFSSDQVNSVLFKQREQSLINFNWRHTSVKFIILNACHIRI